MKSLDDYPGYWFTKSGKVFTMRAGKGILNKSLKHTDKQGYVRVSLIDKYECRVSPYLHRLIGLLFVPNPNNHPLVMHLDNNKTNNDYMNLKWGTHQMNTDQMFGQGRARSKGGKIKLKRTITKFNNSKK